MFQPWRLKLRQAEEALRGGRLDDACRLLSEGQLREYQPALALVTQLADELARRGQRRLAGGDTQAAWHDLAAGARFGDSREAVDLLRQELLRHALLEAERYVAAGNPQAAVESLSEVVAKVPGSREALVLRQAALKVEAARRHARRGRFAEAENELTEALALRPEMASLGELRQQYRSRAEQSRRLAQRLHEALGSQQWTAALTAADEILEFAPESNLARDARHRAWAAVGTQLAESYAPPRAQPPLARLVEGGDTNQAHDTQVATLPTRGTPGPRFLLWVDGVGGYLVCQGSRITLGRPDPDGYVDVPILGDLSTQHAAIRREGESYIFEPFRAARLNGRAVTAPTMLPDAALIELGSSVRIKFRRPHALSGTAVLEFASNHKTQPAADAVLLMAESCVLGPSARDHVVCRQWPQDVVLYQQNGQLACRTKGQFAIDGNEQKERGTLTLSSSVVGDAFSLKLEEV